MSHVNTLISQRLKKTEPSSKMAAMAEKSAAGGLTSFTGIFRITELTAQEKATLEDLLTAYAKNPHDIKRDLASLIAITSEVKAINHQAALLHGERIKKVHDLLTAYKEGAFTQWLLTTYGNRQTPYNLMQYFEFYQKLPQHLRPKTEIMPRQALYTLATREGNFNQKLSLIADYNGETKAELLLKIRSLFPLSPSDRRRENTGEIAIHTLQKLYHLITRPKVKISEKQKETLKELLSDLTSVLKG